MAEAAVLQEYMVQLGFRVDESAQRRFTDSLGNMTGLVMKLGSALAGAGAAVIKAVNNYAAQAEGMSYLSARTGETVKNLEAFTYSLSQLGMKPEQVLSALASIGDAMRDVNNIGITTEFNQRWKGTLTEKLAQYGQYLAGLDEMTRKSQVAHFAPIISPELSLTLQRPGVAEGMKKYLETQQKIGVDPDKLAEDSKKLEQIARETRMKIDTVFKGMAQDLVPHMTDGFKELNKWLDDNAPAVRKKIHEIIESVRSVAPKTFDLTTALTSLLTDSIEWNTTNVLLGAILGKLLWPAFEAAAKWLIRRFWFTALLGFAGPAGVEFTPEERQEIQQQYDKKHGKDASEDPVADWFRRVLPYWMTGANIEHPATVPLYDKTGQPIPGTEHPTRHPGFPYLTPEPKKDEPKPDEKNKKESSSGSSWFSWLIPSAAAEEMPRNIERLADNVGRLNDTMLDHALALQDAGTDLAMKASMSFGGGGGGPGGGGGGGGLFGPGTDVGNVPDDELLKNAGGDATVNDQRSIAMVKYFMSKGYSAYAATGIVANFLAESRLNPRARNASGHEGAAQWDAQRRAQFRQIEGVDIAQSTLAQQAHFAAWELENTHKAVGDRLKKATSAYEAEHAYYKYGEAPGDTDRTEPLRLELQNRLLHDPRLSNYTNTQSATNDNRQVKMDVAINNHITGQSDPYSTARELKIAMDHQHQDTIRHLNTALV